MARDDEFAAFVAARYRALVRRGLLLTGDSGHAEDLTQSTLIRTYLAWGRIRDPANAESCDPATGRWRALPAPPGYPPLAAPPVWAGTQLLELTNSGQLLAFHR